MEFSPFLSELFRPLCQSLPSGKNMGHAQQTRPNWERIGARFSTPPHLAERYGTTLPKRVDEVERLSAKVEEHLKKMGAKWIH
jgi:hypothetical protein